MMPPMFTENTMLLLMAYPKKLYLWPRAFFMFQNFLRGNVFLRILYNYFSLYHSLILLIFDDYVYEYILWMSEVNSALCLADP